MKQTNNKKNVMNNRINKEIIIKSHYTMYRN